MPFGAMGFSSHLRTDGPTRNSTRFSIRLGHHAIKALKHFVQCELLIERRIASVSVRLRKFYPAALQLGLVVRGVIDLAVESQEDAMIIVAHRLVAALRENAFEGERAFKRLRRARLLSANFDRLPSY